MTTTTTPIDSGKISEMLKKSSQKHRMDAKTINFLKGKVSEQEALIKNLELELDSLKMTSSSSSSFLSTTTTTTTTTTNTSKVDPDLEMDCCKQSEISKLDKKDKPIKWETDLMEQPIKNENERTKEFCGEGGKNKIKDNEDDDSDDSDCLETDYLSIKKFSLISGKLAGKQRNNSSINKDMEIIHVDESSGQYQSGIDSTGATNFDELSPKNFCKMDDRHAKKLTFNENTAARSVDRNKTSKAQAQNSIPCQSINDADVVPSKLFDKVLAQNKYLNQCVRDLLIKDGKTMQEYLDNLFLKDLLKGKDFEIKMLKKDVLLLKEQLRSCKCGQTGKMMTASNSKNKSKDNNKINVVDDNSGGKSPDNSLEFDFAAKDKQQQHLQQHHQKLNVMNNSPKDDVVSSSRTVKLMTSTSTATSSSSSSLPAATSSSSPTTTTTTTSAAAAVPPVPDFIKCDNCLLEIERPEFDSHREKCDE